MNCGKAYINQIVLGKVINIEEIWKDIIIEGYDVRYQISNLGRVKSIARLSEQGHWLNEIIMKQCDNRHGYLYVDLYANRRNGYHKIRKYVHRLVAEYFVDNPDPENFKEVDHLDTNPSNNIYTNLRWCTHVGNYENPITVQNEKKAHIGYRPSEKIFENLRKRISVYKDGVLLHTFTSYKDLDENSKEIIGKQLWNVYARQVVKGEREEYNGYQFKLA